MTSKEKLDHLCFLKKEVEHLKTMIRPHDTGHIHTTISTLQDRIKTLYKEVYSREART
tara:strand:- start:415 stop:588 length:174 start_codon:yes stop_codon:yes gene_type:complete